MNRNAWAVRPRPNNQYRMTEFLKHNMVAIGWPATKSLQGLTREQISCRLKETYYQDQSSYCLGQAVGMADRFVNQIKAGDAIVVPDGGQAYFAVVSKAYQYREDFVKAGCPHWISVEYRFDRKPIPRQALPAVLFDALKAWQTLVSLPSALVWQVIDSPALFLPAQESHTDMKAAYIRKLKEGNVPGINSTSFELGVRDVLSTYYPGLQRLSTRNAPAGGDTDLKTTLPGDLVVRIQVKCKHLKGGPLGKDAVIQLRNSMEPGEFGILVTTNDFAEDARRVAEADAEKPVGLIDGEAFAELLFQNLDNLTGEQLWQLGIRHCLK